MKHTSLEVEKILTQDQKNRRGRYWIILPESYLKKIAFLCAYFKSSNSLLLRASTCVMIDELLEEIVGDKKAVDELLAKIQKPYTQNLERRLLQKASIKSGMLSREDQIKYAMSSRDVVKPSKTWSRKRKNKKKNRKKKQ